MELPHTITYAIIYRNKIDSMIELTEANRPPRNLWDKPYRLSLFFDKVFNRKPKDSVITLGNIEDVE